MKLEKKAPPAADITNLPKPRPAGAGARKAVTLAVLAALAVGGTAFWLTRDKATRDHWREEAASVIDNATSGTPLAGVGNVLRDAPPPPPPSVLSPVTAPGTLAGQTVQGSVGQTGVQDGASGPAVQTAEAVPPKVPEASRVRPEFVQDLAAYLAGRFKPGPHGGVLQVSVQGLNQRYGTRLPGIAGGPGGGRAALLRYAFHPTMLQGLYALYVDRFLEDLNREALARNFTPEQTRQLHMAVAGRAVLLAGALEAAAAQSDLDKRLHQLEQAAQAVVDINSQMAEAVFALDELRENKAGETEIATAQLRADGLSARYRRALEERAAVQRSLVGAVRQGGGQALDDDTLLFVAQWVDRRLRENAQARAAVQSSAGILRDLARRCAQTGTAAPRPTAGPAPGASVLAPAAGPQDLAPRAPAGGLGR
jgi:hypothetical protein